MELNDVQRKFIAEKLDKLSKSKFRSSFILRRKEFEYLKYNGISKIEDHAYSFVRGRLGGSIITNDGKQTPMRGHPVFVAQHATATCCRECLYKWHHIPKNRKLQDKEIRFIVALIVSWILKESESRWKCDFGKM